jgi:hypothetical protein
VSAQDSPGEEPSSAEPPAGSPEQRAARERADAIVHRRENPEHDPAQFKRPRTVLIGCVMAWIGAAVSIYGGLRSLAINRDSSVMDDVDPDQISSTLQSYHAVGWVSLVWGVLLVLFALQAFLGARWAATALVSMAGVVLLFGLLSLTSNFAPEGAIVTMWSITSATLVRYREDSRNWYATLAEARRT